MQTGVRKNQVDAKESLISCKDFEPLPTPGQERNLRLERAKLLIKQAQRRGALLDREEIRGAPPTRLA